MKEMLVGLFPNGVFMTRSNEVETVCRRISPAWNMSRVVSRGAETLRVDFKDEPFVVIGGDFNTSIMLPDGKTEVNTPEDYEAFLEAGCVGAHWGTIATWPAEKPHLTIDNVFARGLKISEVKVVNDPRLSDHALLRCRLTFED